MGSDDTGRDTSRDEGRDEGRDERRNERSGDGRPATAEVATELSGVRLFAELNDTERAFVAGACEAVDLLAGDWLFREGDVGDSLFVVRSGRVEVFRTTPAGETSVSLLSAGGVLGELSLLLGTPRSASVRAVRDTRLLRIGREPFAALLQESPSFAGELLRAVGRQLQSTGRPTTDTPAARDGVLALRPLHGGLPVAEIVDAMASALRQWGSVTVIDGADLGAEPDGGETALGRLLDRVEREVDRVLLVAGVEGTARWDEFCARQADRSVLLVDPARPPGDRLAEGEVGAVGSGSGGAAGVDLAFVARAARARNRRPWLDAFAPRAQHLVRPGPDLVSDVARLARRITGHSIGIVLSGGGARGFAHIGVLDALTAAGIEIDRVGGCSMGAFVGGLFAMGTAPADIARTCRHELVDANPFNDYVIPRHSLIRASKAEAMLQRVFGRTQIEELERDFFAVCADLVNAELVVARRGPLWSWVGASMSLPGLVQPVRDGSRLLIDGGVLDNLPVDVMADAAEGPVIAVDVMGGRRARAPAREVKGRRPWRWLVGTDDPDGVAPPTIIETLSWATVLGSWRLAERNRERATLVIAPPVGDTGLLQFEHIDRLVAAGREGAHAALADSPLPR